MARRYENESFAHVKKFCPVCDRKVEYFLHIGWDFIKELDEHGFIHSITNFETFNLTEYFCPYCKSSDKERLYALFFKRFLKELAPESPVLEMIDFAPGDALAHFFRTCKQLNYFTTDIVKPGVDLFTDITNMIDISSNSIDIFLCSHVVEHVKNDCKALSELCRILKSGGLGVLMAPVLLNLDKTYENNDINEDALRTKHFMQSDHFRVYSKKGFAELIENAGFTFSAWGIDSFGENAFSLHGIHRRSVLYVLRKPRE